MRAYVTGSQGFVGRWLVRHLVEQGDDVVQPEHEIDVTDPDALMPDMVKAEPDAVYHLAAKSHVGASWSDPLETLRVNVLGAEVMIEAAAACDRPPRVLMVSSAEVYGTGAGEDDDAALTEESPLRPLSPYAASKAAAEMLAVQAGLGRGIDVIRVRPFNHVGPGQSDSFVVSAFARRVAAAEREGKSTIPVGNLSVRRDFSDVRDVVKAYRLLVASGVAGEVYNVCSGTSVGIDEVVDRLLALATRKIVPVEDPELLRPAEISELRGDCSRLRAATGWLPHIKLETTLAEMLDWWRERDEARPAPGIQG